MNPDAIIKKVSATLRRLGPMDRQVYKRTSTITGDSLLGRTSTTHVDVPLDPQPSYSSVGIRDAILLSRDGTRSFLPSDLQFICSVEALTKSELETAKLQLVLKDARGREEVFAVFGYDAPSMGGKVLALMVYARGVAS